MIFEFKATSADQGMLGAFAAAIGTKLDKGLLTLPASLGKGAVKGIVLGPLMRIMIFRFELKEDLLFRRMAAPEEKEGIVLTFHNVSGHVSALSGIKLLPAVQVVSNDIVHESFFPAGTPVNSILIATHADLFQDLSSLKTGDAILQNIIAGTHSYLYEEIISPEMQALATDIMNAHAPAQLLDLYLKLKAQELIYLFFVELLKREGSPAFPLNAADVKMMYQLRDKIIADLSITPNLPELARFAGMSESKMKRLFKQIFGNSIYNYYQSLRMHAAADLIREQGLSVSEAGYRLGFTNLSHFTRMFEKHIGLKPKKYAAAS